jgi:hypothetical protein
MIVTTLMLFSWIAGVFSNKKIDEESPEDISSYNAPTIEMNKDNETPEVQIPEPLSNPENDAPEEIISSDDNIPTIVQMDKDLDNEKPEVPMPEPLSHPQQDAPDVEIENLIKILDAANHQLSRVALLLAEVDKPDESDEDSDESEDEGPPHSFADTEILNETDEETPEVLTPQLDPEADAIVAADVTDQKIIADATHQPGGLENLIETDERTQPDAHSEVSGETDNNLAENVNFTFKVTKFPNLPDPYYITLNLNEPVNGKIRKTKIISTRDPQWNKKSFSFYVRNAEDATITCKLKRKALLGLKKSTKKVKTTKLINNGKEFQLLTDFKVAVVTQLTEVKETKRELAKKKREKRKLKERLAFCEKNGIDPYVRMGSDETFGQRQKDQNTEETKWIFISGIPRETIV